MISKTIINFPNLHICTQHIKKHLFQWLFGWHYWISTHQEKNLPKISVSVKCRHKYSKTCKYIIMMLWNVFRVFSNFNYKFLSKSLKSPINYLSKTFHKQMFQDENYEWHTNACAQNDQGWKCNMKFRIKLQQIENEYLRK